MRSWMIILFGLAAACSAAEPVPQANPIAFDITPPSPKPGEEVTLTLVNGSTNPIGYNLCTSTLMHDDGTEWEPVRSDRVCTMELRTLAPAAQDSFSIPLPADLPPGSYRFQTMIGALPDGAPTPLDGPMFLILE